MRVDGVLLTPSDCLTLAGWVEQVMRRDPSSTAPVGAVRAILRDVNAAALNERRRRTEQQWRVTLLPISEAAARLGVPARTLRSRAERGLVAAVKDERGHWLVEAA